MSLVSCDVTELKNLPKDIGKWDKATQRVADRAVTASAERLEAQARGSVARDTGALYGSIGMDQSSRLGNDFARRVWADDDAALEEEYGTATQVPHPFLMIHADQAGEELYRRLVNDLPVTS